VLLAGTPGTWIAVVCLLAAAAVLPPTAALALTAAVLVPYVPVLGMRRSQIERLRLPRRWPRWPAAAAYEEEAELAEAIRPRPGNWRDAAAAAAALVTVVAASSTMELAGTALSRRYAVPDIVTGALVLAVVTSLPNAVTAVYLARRGRGAAVLSTALNSNAINVAAGLLIPVSLTGLGPPSGQDMLVAGWYAGLTMLTLAYAYRGRSLDRLSGATIIAGYLAFVCALSISVTRGHVGPAAAILPAVITAGALPLLHAAHRAAAIRRAAAGLDRASRRQSLLPGWSVGRVWALSLILCAAIAACDAASGPHLPLIGLLIVGPCCGLLTARWAPTATAGCFVLTLAVLVSIPDQIFATAIQYAFLAAVAMVSLTAILGAAVLQRQRP
jgi:cation:H+ antiporter